MCSPPPPVMDNLCEERKDEILELNTNIQYWSPKPTKQNSSP
ncbi:BnaA03g52300D [Brassica napus]|uniref:(rape) hypothetical protein n=1 Tax=Brassica napus TaxID=3708 RepID=A0A078FKM2_BRANA|nr:unnamed protein product [Brassica napus]CDY13512.1 BnaA03g52300D [Brassica napus]